MKHQLAYTVYLPEGKERSAVVAHRLHMETTSQQAGRQATRRDRQHAQINPDNARAASWRAGTGNCTHKKINLE